jgi:ABC-type Mn2+/Zn2+ transport system permease subunit
LAVGWAIGTVVSAVGAALSYAMDLPTGATIVCVFGLTLLIVATLVAVRDSRLRSKQELPAMKLEADRVHERV